MSQRVSVFMLVLAGVLSCATQGLSQSLYDDVPVPIDPAGCVEHEQNWAERALARSLTPPLGLPPIPHPAENPPTAAKIELGRKLFFDRRLSINRTMSCAMCHVPEQGFVNWELQTSVGVEGRSVKRNAPTIVNVGYMTPLFHDGRDPALETQYVSPLTARNEMANPSIGGVIGYLRELPDYQPLFAAAFEAQASLDRVGQALAAYQRSVVAGGSNFDRWLYGGEEKALSDAAKRGYEIFTGRADCASCHSIGEKTALFTDLDFHDTGYGWMRERDRQVQPDTARIQVAPGIFYDVAFEKVAAVGQERDADLGRYEVTEAPADRWKFRTPSLRNVALTRPYMHDGALTSLGDVIRFYNEGGPGHPQQTPLVRPLGLSDGELADLEAFLISLTSPDLDCLAAEARSHPPDNY